MKELSRRVLRCSFWCVVVCFSQLIADDGQKTNLFAYDTQESCENVVVRQEFKAPRPQGNTVLAVPIPSPVVESVVASVAQVQTEVRQLQTEVTRINQSETKLDACCLTMNNKLDILLEETGSILDNLNVSVNLSTIESKLDFLIDDVSVIESMLENLNVDIDMTTLESKLDSCCLTMNNKLDTILEDTESILDNLNVSVNLSTIESKLDFLIDDVSIIESMLENINVDIDMTTLESKLDACCFTTNGKLDLLIDDVSVVESLIIEGGACEPTSLSSADVVGNVMVLAVSGNYCLAHDVGLSGAVTVSLTADNITLCLNNRELIGHIEVYGARAQIKNGSVTFPAGTTGVKIAATAPLTSLSHVKIVGASGGAGTALEVRADNCLICDSLCAGGGTGGDGIALYGSEILVHNVEATAFTIGGGHCSACYAPASKNSIKLCRCDGRDGSLTPGAGCGIYIAPGCTSIEIRDGTLARTASFAIEDNHVVQNDVTSYSSVIYNNFAYDSAQSSATYQIRNKKSMGQSYGVDLISGSPGLYANVYIP